MTTPVEFNAAGINGLWQTFKNWWNGRHCPSCGRCSPRWCNYFDWYADGTKENPAGSNCTWDKIVLTIK